jgi:hypothetical protein
VHLLILLKINFHSPKVTFLLYPPAFYPPFNIPPNTLTPVYGAICTGCYYNPIVILGLSIPFAVGIYFGAPKLNFGFISIFTTGLASNGLASNGLTSIGLISFTLKFYGLISFNFWLKFVSNLGLISFVSALN